MLFDIDFHKTLRAGSRHFRLHVTLRSDSQRVVIHGPSGAGKSQTLQAIAGLLQPDGGHIRIGGRTLFDAAAGILLSPQARRCGYLFQDYALFPHMTVGENLAFPLEVRGMSKAERESRVIRALDMVQMGRFRTRRPAQLSGGQQQRAAIARALCMEPRALLFDEPTSALDPELEQEVVKVIKALAEEGRTMLIVTHDMKMANDVSDHVIFLHQGKIEEQGPPDQLFGNPQTERLRGFLSATMA